jgi:Methyltransferase FkbM domain
MISKMCFLCRPPCGLRLRR